MKKQQRAISKLGRKFDFDPETVSNNNTGGNFDPKNLSPDDVKKYKELKKRIKETAFKRILENNLILSPFFFFL